MKLLSVTLLLSAFLVVSGCGGGGFKNPNQLLPPTGNGTPPGNFTVSVTGADASGKTVAVATVGMKVGI